MRSAWISQSNSRAKLSPVASRALDDIVGPAMDTVSSLDGAAPRRLIVGITGGTGAAFGVKLLQTLRDSPLETHLVMCDCSRATILAETGLELGQIRKLADRVYALARGSIALEARTGEPDLPLRLEHAYLAVVGHRPPSG